MHATPCHRSSCRFDRFLNASSRICRRPGSNARACSAACGLCRSRQRSGRFLLAHDLETGQRFVLEGSDLDTGYVPWSTFKIPNLLMALEAASRRIWRRPLPGIRRAAPPSHGGRMHGDRTRPCAPRSSALRPGISRMSPCISGHQPIARPLTIGHMAMPSHPTDLIRSGLPAGLEISVSQQVRFLERVVRQNLAVSPSAHEALMEASLAQQEDDHALHGKTGAGPSLSGDFSGPFEGWYVGFVQRREAAPIVFALHAAGPDWPSIRTFRQDFAVRLLVDAELLPASFAN